MIDEIENQISSWISSELDNLPVNTKPPGETAQEKCVGLYLLDLLPSVPVEQNPSQYFQLSLRFLITAWADSPEEAHRFLGQLALSVSEHPEYDLELNPLSAQSWSAFGIAPRPSFMLRAQLRKERKHRTAKMIREPMILKKSAMVTFQGKVVGPNQLPISGAFVELTSLERTTYTDNNGCFAFTAVPAEPSRKKLRIKSKGRELAVLADHGANASEPVVIHVDIAEV